jgi:hypothetical protein
MARMREGEAQEGREGEPPMKTDDTDRRDAIYRVFTNYGEEGAGSQEGRKPGKEGSDERSAVKLWIQYEKIRGPEIERTGPRFTKENYRDA